MRRLLLLGPAALAGMASLATVLLVAAIDPAAGQGAPSTLAASDIPSGMLVLYQRAAASCPGLAWPVLAAIGKVESDHGRSTAPGVHAGANPAGAAGPMQVGIGGRAGDTWAAAKVEANGDPPGSPGFESVYEPADAVFAAARYLCANGAGDPAGLRQALVAYNHAWWYVDRVLAVAAQYALPVGGTASSPSAAAEGAVRFALGQVGTPYRWDAVGPNAYDCSGLTLAAYHAVGIRLPRTAAQQWGAGARVAGQAPGAPNPAVLAPGDLVFFADDTADPASIHHVGLYVGQGLMVEAPHTGALVRVQRVARPDYIGATRPTA